MKKKPSKTTRINRLATQKFAVASSKSVSRKKPGPKPVVYAIRDLEKPLQEVVNKAVRARTEANEAKREALRLTEAACKRLAKSGVTIQNTADLLDLSVQRVMQLRA